MDIGMAFEPAVILGLVGIEVVQNDVNFFFVSVAIDDAVHEIQELPASPAFVMTGLNQAGGGFQGGKECRCAVPFVFMSKAGNGPSVGQPDVALSPLDERYARD